MLRIPWATQAENFFRGSGLPGRAIVGQNNNSRDKSKRYYYQILTPDGPVRLPDKTSAAFENQRERLVLARRISQLVTELDQ